MIFDAENPNILKLKMGDPKNKRRFRFWTPSFSCSVLALGGGIPNSEEPIEQNDINIIEL